MRSSPSTAKEHVTSVGPRRPGRVRQARKQEAKAWCENQNLQPKEEPNTAFESHTAAILSLSAEKPIEKDNELKGFFLS